MSSKRALVVDDSKSARAFLSRILERHEITVDAAESAEAAIEYLTRNKPDVIFMDHMMPGMDGFQAVQSIKNNPRTSTIPILMYTSQEGDLYAGQARALGAEGVLPKQIKHSDVTKMLFQLRLVTDRRGGEQSTLMRMAHGPELMPANESAIVVEPQVDQPAPEPMLAVAPEISQLLPQMTLEIRAALDASLQRELGSLRGFLMSSLDSQTERLQSDLTALVPPRAPEIAAPTLMPERRSWSAIVGWTLAMLAVAAACFMGWMWWQQGGEMAALRTDLDAAYAEVETLRARPVVSPPAEEPAVDPAAILPAADAPDASAVSTSDVQLVPASGATIVPPAEAAGPAAAAPAAAVVPATAEPAATVPATAAPAAQPLHQAQ
jgi:CheY-like chemotaxis protein